jgi:hypothetical protein
MSWHSRSRTHLNKRKYMTISQNTACATNNTLFISSRGYKSISLPITHRLSPRRCGSIWSSKDYERITIAASGNCMKTWGWLSQTLVAITGRSIQWLKMPSTSSNKCWGRLRDSERIQGRSGKRQKTLKLNFWWRGVAQERGREFEKLN